MNVTVKKLKTFWSSEWGADGGADCDLYINGIKVGFVHDAGEGGELDFYPEETLKAQQVLAEFEKYVDGLPEYDLNENNRLGTGKPTMYKKTFKDVIGDAINDAINERNAQKNARQFEKASRNGIVIGVPNSGKYYEIHWKKLTLADMVILPKGKGTLQSRVNVAKMELQKGEEILNADYLRSLGIKV